MEFVKPWLYLIVVIKQEESKSYFYYKAMKLPSKYSLIDMIKCIVFHF